MKNTVSTSVDDAKKLRVLTTRQDNSYYGAYADPSISEVQNLLRPYKKGPLRKDQCMSESEATPKKPSLPLLWIEEECTKDEKQLIESFQKDSEDNVDCTLATANGWLSVEKEIRAELEVLLGISYDRLEGTRFLLAQRRNKMPIVYGEQNMPVGAVVASIAPFYTQKILNTNRKLGIRVRPFDVYADNRENDKTNFAFMPEQSLKALWAPPPAYVQICDFGPQPICVIVKKNLSAQKRALIEVLTEYLESPNVCFSFNGLPLCLKEKQKAKKV